MIDLSDELLRDFLVEAEEYDDRIQEGLEMIRNGKVSLGVDTIFRPIHTIKGTAGFIDGLDKLASFSHIVEDYLKRYQAGEIVANRAAVDLLIQGVDEMFKLMEQIRKGASELDDEEARAVAEAMKTFGTDSRPEAGPVQAIAVERQGSATLVRINIRRVHLPGQFKGIVDALDGLGPSENVGLDLSRVRTLGSTAWGAIWEAGQKGNLSVFGMNAACRTVFERWGFEQVIRNFASEEDFLKARL